MFWKKVECDGCLTKLWPSKAMLHRGSYFCSTACRDAWSIKNPPLVARGTPEQLRANLIATIDTALDEYQQSVGGGTFEQAIGRMLPVIGSANASYDAQVQYEHSQRFTQYALECIPLLHGLGYTYEVAVVETLGFGGRIPDVLAALQGARARAIAG
jgi:hypothetical protein